MHRVLIYHNPACAQSRGVIDILRQRGVEFDTALYLENLLTSDDFARILTLLPIEPRELVRKEERFEQLGLDEADYRNREQVIALLLVHPELMQRPIVIRGGRAVIARPSERVLEILD